MNRYGCVLFIINTTVLELAELSLVWSSHLSLLSTTCRVQLTASSWIISLWNPSDYHAADPIRHTLPRLAAKNMPHIKGQSPSYPQIKSFNISICNYIFPTTSQIPSANQTWLAGKSHLLMELFVAKNRWFSSHGTDYRRVTIVFITIHQNYV